MNWQSIAQELLRESLASTQVESWAVNTMDFKSDTISDEQWQNLNSFIPDNIKKAYIKRQSSFYYGRLCAETALQQLDIYSGLLRGDRGQPIWPNDILGSISHTDSLAMSIVIKSKEILGVGLDVETILSHEDSKTIYNSVLTPYEQQCLSQWQQQSNLNHAALLTLIFSIKESFYKSIHDQVNTILEFDAIEVTSITHGKSHYHNITFNIIEPLVLDTLKHSSPLSISGYYTTHNGHIVTCVCLPLLASK